MTDRTPFWQLRNVLEDKNFIGWYRTYVESMSAAGLAATDEIAKAENTDSFTTLAAAVTAFTDALEDPITESAAYFLSANINTGTAADAQAAVILTKDAATALSTLLTALAVPAKVDKDSRGPEGLPSFVLRDREIYNKVVRLFAESAEECANAFIMGPSKIQDYTGTGLEDLSTDIAAIGTALKPYAKAVKNASDSLDRAIVATFANNDDPVKDQANVADFITYMDAMVVPTTGEATALELAVTKALTTATTA